MSSSTPCSPRSRASPTAWAPRRSSTPSPRCRQRTCGAPTATRTSLWRPPLRGGKRRKSPSGGASATQAAEEANVPGGVDVERLGVLVGTGVGGLQTLEDQCRNFFEGGERAVSPHFVPMMMPNAAAGVIAMRLGAHGPGFSVSSACATGGHAIGEALRMITRGEADVVVAGGTEAALTGVCLAAFRRMGALSREGVSRPFDVRRDGFVMGEGAAVIVLERAEHAKARGATIYGRIAGYGASNDAFHITQPDSEGRGAKAAMLATLADAGA